MSIWVGKYEHPKHGRVIEIFQGITEEKAARRNGYGNTLPYEIMEIIQINVPELEAIFEWEKGDNKMEKYRKRVFIVDAVQWLGDPVALEGLEDVTLKENGDLMVATLEGELRAPYSHWIIRGIEGELYPCDPDIFEKLYEKVED